MQPEDPVQPTACFGTAYKLRKVFTLLNDWEKDQKKNNASLHVKVIYSNLYIHK